MIGNVELNNNLLLAPMAGVTDLAFRKICKECGAGFVEAEMVSAKAIFYGDDKTISMLNTDGEKRPISMQIFGNEPDVMAYAAEFLNDKADIIDINMGCPVPKVAIKSQAGSALLKNPDKIKEIVSAVVKAVSVPVTVKIRSGWDANSVNAVEVAKVIEEAGASAITVHGRTRAQGYSGNADWNIIKQVKEMVSIPVIGNGDVTSAEKAKEMLDFTGCDAVMIGRGVLGNPWLINECVSYLESGIIPLKPSAREKIEMLKRHYQLLVDSTSEKQAILEIRTHALWYIKGMPKSAYIKNKICKTKNSEDLFKILNDYLGDLDD